MESCGSRGDIGTTLGRSTMIISREELLAVAEITGFRPEMVEKAMLLLHLLNSLFRHPFLKKRLVLKGGTALNLFLMHIPRLSIDLDLNYIGSPNLHVMEEEKPKVEEAIRAVCEREGFTVRRGLSEEHAGGKWSLRYRSSLGTGGNLAIDLNYMFRVPLWPSTLKDSKPLGIVRARNIPVIDIYELLAGKLVALFSRKSARDLFDVHLSLTSFELEQKRLRVAFVVYGAMSRKDWRQVSTKDLEFRERDLRNHLLPLLQKDYVDSIDNFSSWASRLLDECRKKLKLVLPFNESEMEFLDRLLEHGEIVPSLLTSDKALAERIQKHPMLRWKAFNVQKFKGIQ